MALALYLATLATAILAGRVFARWIGWTAASSAVLVLAGDLLNIGFDAAFLAVLAGYVLFVVVLIALGVALWRQGDAVHRRDAHRVTGREPGAARPASVGAAAPGVCLEAAVPAAKGPVDGLVQSHRDLRRYELER
jgi:hypothetical protein